MPAAASAYGIEEQRRLTPAKNYFAWQAALAKPALGRRVVEVGCGIGNFTAHILDRELVVAVDSDPDGLDELRARFPAEPNLQIMRAEALDLHGLARFHPDSCVCLNVLEHVADDAAGLRAMAGILPRGGKIVLLVPAFPALYGPIDRRLDHYRRYRRATIAALAAGAGLRIEMLRYMNLPGFFGWWINAHVFKRQEQSPLQIRVFDRALVPVISRLEEFASPPFGQSIFGVLVKP